MASGNIVIAVAGNKCDLADIREIPTERRSHHKLNYSPSQATSKLLAFFPYMHHDGKQVFNTHSDILYKCKCIVKTDLAQLFV